MKKKLIISTLMLPAAVSVLFYYFNSSPSCENKKNLTVNYGDTLKSISRLLEKNCMIKNVKFFAALSYVTNRRYVKAGKYTFYPGMSSLEILKKITRGDVIAKKITIPEGYNLYQIAEKLEADHITRNGDFLYQSFERDFLKSVKINAPSAEGYLFPDTYVFPLGSDAREILVIMYRKMKTVVREIDPSLMHGTAETHKILTLASFIEMESGVSRERAYISSVFHNRLNTGMRLDCDPTVRYALKKFTGSITRRDLSHDSPYNTYLVTGLTPTPICAPGRDSIRAAVYPKRTDYLYFVAKLNGEHYFSRTLREHSLAARFFLKGEKNGFTDTQKLE